jgi:predicted ATPase/DNA-binding CsgD family transcriptional regulator
LLADFKPYISPTTLVGRRKELQQLTDWLQNEECRLVTLVGPGGIGKTRLAAELCDSWGKGLIWVPLDDAEEHQSVLNRLGHVLELPECSEAEWHERLDTLLRAQTLVVLDSFEHLRGQAPEVAGLLRRHAQLKVLATSRAPLLLTEERLLTLEPLNLEQSVELLMVRARAVRPDLEATDANRRILEELCRRLDGIPLALELAAARLRHLGLAELEEGLRQSIALLSGGGADRPARQQTLAATLEWSCQLLQASERELLSRLAVFRGGFEGRAASALCPQSALTELLSLADQSLVVASHSSTGETRYALLDTVRNWVESALSPTEGAANLAQAHAEYYLELAETTARCRGSENHALGLKQLSCEKANLSRALQTFQETERWTEALRLVGCLGWYWEACSLLTEGNQALLSALEANQSGPESSDAHYWLGVLLRHQGDYDLAQQHAERALEYRLQGRTEAKRDDRAAAAQISEALSSLGQLSFRQGDYQTSEAHFTEALETAREGGAVREEVTALNGLGRLAWVRGRVSEGIEFEHQSLRLSQEHNYPLGEAWAHNALGEIHRNLQEPRAAALHFRRASERFGSLHEFSLAALALQNLAYVELGLKRWNEAELGFREALSLWRRAGARHGLALCLIGLAGVLSAQKRDVLGAKFLGAADSLLESIQVRLEASDQDDYAQIQGALRSRLGDGFKVEHWAGRQTSLDELLQLLNATTKPSSAEGLTPRERDVLKATATGASNKEVADILVISPQTVMVHLRSIYRKLNVSSRTAASRWAVDNGLLDSQGST